MITVLDKFQKLNKQKKQILNQKKHKLVHFLINKTKKFHRTIKNSLKMWQQVGVEYLNG